MSQPRILFAGTPEFAATHLEALLNSGFNICGVYTQPDRPAGRGRKLQKSPVKLVAEAKQLKVFQPENFKTSESKAELSALKPDLMIVVAYGLILPQAVLDIPVLGCINVHASLLPKWRGAAPIHRSLLSGETRTGVTLMQMEAGLDTGPMLCDVDTHIDTTDTSRSLHDRLAALGSELLVNSLPDILASKLKPKAQQDSLATYAHKLEKREGLIDWNLSAVEIDRQIRGLNPWPIAFTNLEESNLRIWEAEPLDKPSSGLPGTVIRAEREGLEISCGAGQLRLKKVQLPGKKAMNVSDLLNSANHPLTEGTVLGK